MKIIKNGKIFYRGAFINADIAVLDGKITQIAPKLDGDTLFDAEGCLVLPGLVDIHTHGCFGTDFCDSEDGALENIATFLAKNGITSFLGTSMSFGEDTLTPLFERAGRFVHLPKEGMAVMWGINMEGPYINTAKKGAQSAENIFSPDIDTFNRLNDAAFGAVRLVDVAPECVGALDFIREVSQTAKVSLAHTDADYDEATAGFMAGATHVTHLFNAMRSYQHRDPGLIGAAGDHAQYVEIISDGIHLHPSVVRNVFRQFKGRVCLISDSMSATGLKNGEYTLGGQAVFMSDGKCTLKDGTIAGSATCLADCLRRCVSFGVPLEEAITAATINPAKAVDIDSEIGSIEQGKRADFLITGSDLNKKAVVLSGKLLEG